MIGSSMQLRALSADSSDDMQLLHSWFAEFLQEAMHSLATPSDSQVQVLLQPWMKQGQFHVLQAAGQPVCLLCHVPTTNSSSRIVLVYTPEQHRRRGHARVAVAQLCSQLSRRYSHICLMASQANATANRAYQDVGFVTVEEMCILKNAADGPAGAAPG